MQTNNMYKILVFFTAVTSAYADVASLSQPDRIVESQQAALWEQTLQDVKELEEIEKMNKLWLGLRNMGHRKSLEGHSQEIDLIYSKLQNEFMKYPNHAQYFRDQINALFDPVTNERTKESGNDQRYLISETMCHVPSPEMVYLLGEMLDDERGKIDDPRNQLGPTSNADLACEALIKIGLENIPVPREKGMELLAFYRKDTWKLWWGPIKAGNRAFSFEGQDVEYRFRKDGTYETLPRSGAQKRNTQDVAGGVENHSAKIGKPAQRWLILLAGCAALVAWLRWKSKRRNA